MQWNRFPLVRLLLPFVTGIGCAIVFPYYHPFLLLLPILFLLLSLFFAFYSPLYDSYQNRSFFGFAIMLICFSLAYAITALKSERYAPDHYTHFIHDDPQTILLRIIEPPAEKTKSIKTLVEVVQLNDSTGTVSTRGKALLYLEKDSLAKALRYGDLLLAHTHFQEIEGPKNPYVFNYKSYLLHRQVYRRLYLKKTDWQVIARHRGSPWLSKAIRLRTHLLKQLAALGMEAQEQAVMGALLLGYREALDKELMQAYSGAGVIHVLAVSGLHVGIIYLLLSFSFAFLNRLPHGRLMKVLLVILALWGYATITGLSPSVVRAATMFSFVAAGRLLKRPTNIYNTITASAFLLLLINPYLLVAAGFQLSYLAVLAIVWLQPMLYKLWQPTNSILDKTWAITTVSLAAQIGTFPLSLFYFHQFPTLFLFANLLVIPLVTILIYFGMALLLISLLVKPPLFMVLALQWLLKAMNHSVTFIENVEGSVIKGIYLSLQQFWLLYLALFLLLLYFSRKKKYVLIPALVLLLLLLSTEAFERFRQNRQRMMLVYDVPRSTAVDFIEGDQYTFIADRTLLKDQGQQAFHIQPNRQACNTSERASFSLDSLPGYRTEALRLSAPFVQFGTKRIAWLYEELPDYKGSPLKVDYVLLSQNPRISIGQISQYYDFGLLIIDSSNRSWNTKRWIKESKELSINYHDVNSQGAFILNLKF